MAKTKAQKEAEQRAIKGKCLTCDNDARCRGLCVNCRNCARATVARGDATDEGLIRKGLLLPAKTVGRPARSGFKKKFAGAARH